MDSKKLHALLILIIPKTIEQIAIQTKIPEIEIIKSFYQSKVYELLEDEKTGLWNYSALTLCNMFITEQETGKIAFPEGT